MDTIGYAIEEWIYVPSEMHEALGSEEPKWKKRAKLVIVIILFLTFALFSFYQGWLSYQSYKSPAWTSYEEERPTANFPGVLLCPSRSLKKSLTNAGCLFEDNQMVVNNNSNFTLCDSRKVITDSLDKTLFCFNYNFDATAVADATNSYLIVYAGMQNNTNNNNNNSRHEVESELSKQKNDVPNFQYPMLLYVYPVGTDYNFQNGTVPNNLKPSAMITSDGTTYVMLRITEYEYLNGSIDIEYSLSISSTPFGAQTSNISVLVYFSYASLRVTVWSQYIAHDWITACGVVAGLTGFLRSCWYVAFMILDKLQKKWEKGEKMEKMEGETDMDTDNSMASMHSMKSLDQMRQPLVELDDE